MKSINLVLSILFVCLFFNSSFGQFSLPGQLDTTFNFGVLQNSIFDVPSNPQLGQGADNQIRAIAYHPDGKVLIGGFFTSYNGTIRNRIARLNVDGSLDGTFNPGIGANDQITSLTLQPDGKLLIVGLFTSFNGTICNRVARLNTNGSVDATFNSASGANDWVTCLTLQPDGKVIIGGYFNTYNGTSKNYLARLNTNGSLDTSFITGTGANVFIFSVAIQPDGRVLIGGDFTSYNGTLRNRIARLNADGTLDNSFNPGTGANNTVQFQTLQPDGKVLIGGDFTGYNGIVRNRIARLNVDGSLDATLNPVLGANSKV